MNEKPFPYDLPGIQSKIINSHIRLAIKSRQEILDLREKLARTELEMVELKAKLAKLAGRRDPVI